MAIRKATLEVVVLYDDTTTDAPYGSLDLGRIHYDISEGPCIGDVNVVSDEVVHPKILVSELVAIGNDGTFFDDGSGD